ncbi:MAG: hypothetical protein ACTSR2_12905 [Candidatus Hodarchaeales archaeon]
MVIQGIEIKETIDGMQIILKGELYRSIAKEWEKGNVERFYSHLKTFIKHLQEEYSD